MTDYYIKVAFVVDNGMAHWLDVGSRVSQYVHVKSLWHEQYHHFHHRHLATDVANTLPQLLSSTDQTQASV